MIHLPTWPNAPLMHRGIARAGHVADVLRVQRFGFQQGVRKGVERAAVRRQHPVGLAVTFLDGPPDLGTINSDVASLYG
jgi:hypothetical protein